MSKTTAAPKTLAEFMVNRECQKSLELLTKPVVLVEKVVLKRTVKIFLDREGFKLSVSSITGTFVETIHDCEEILEEIANFEDHPSENEIVEKILKALGKISR